MLTCDSPITLWLVEMKEKRDNKISFLGHQQKMEELNVEHQMTAKTSTSPYFKLKWKK